MPSTLRRSSTTRTESASPKSTTNPLFRLGGAATALAAILGLVFLVFPTLKPPLPPPVLSGSISTIVWQQVDSGSLHYAVTARLVGYKGKPCTLGYAVYRSDGQYAGIGAAEVLTLTPESEDDTGGSSTVAVPQPLQAGQYYVQFTLNAPNGSRLDTKASAFFTVP
jgi:hypothetical protein